MLYYLSNRRLLAGACGQLTCMLSIALDRLTYLASTCGSMRDCLNPRIVRHACDPSGNTCLMVREVQRGEGIEWSLRQLNVRADGLERERMHFAHTVIQPFKLGNIEFLKNIPRIHLRNDDI